MVLKILVTFLLHGNINFVSCHHPKKEEYGKFFYFHLFNSLSLYIFNTFVMAHHVQALMHVLEILQ